MQKTKPYILEEAQFKDYELDFPYRIIHKQGDTDYLCGTLSSALSECSVFKDTESFAYFYALLVNSSILIPVHIIINPEETHELSAIETDVDIIEGSVEKVTIVPELFFEDDKSILPICTSIRELSCVPPLFSKEDIAAYKENIQKTLLTKPMSQERKQNILNILDMIKPFASEIFMYVEFEKFYKWLKENSEKIDTVCFSKYQYDVDSFISTIEYAIHDFLLPKDRLKRINQIRQIALNKHMPKKRNKK